MGDWLIIYLVGCALALLLYLSSAGFFAVLNWILKGNVLRKNLSKLDAPDDETFGSKAANFAFVLALEVTLSWINVVLIVALSACKLFKILREVITVMPEECKRLRFPLLNNPNLSMESVWAHVLALEATAGGEQPNESKLLWSLQSAVDNRPDFDRVKALEQLRSLNAVTADTVNRAIEQLPGV